MMFYNSITKSIQMKASVQTLLQGIHWDSKQSLGGVTFVPIIGELENHSSGIEIGAEDLDTIQVTELEPEDVNNVNIHSEYQGTVLIIAGMVLMGGRQTRSPTRPFIINKGTKYKIPVNCIEQGRWSYTPGDAVDKNEKQFKMMKRMVSHKTRSSYAGGGMSQSSTWNSISHYMSEHDLSDIDIPTQSYLGVEEAIKSNSGEELDKIRTLLKPVFSHEHQRGVLMFESGKLTNIEVFDNPDYWMKISTQMMESNLIDVLKLQKEEEKKINENLDFGKIKIEKSNPVADEISYSTKFENQTGWAIEDDAKIVYFNLTQKIEGGNDSFSQARFQTNNFESMGEQVIRSQEQEDPSDLE
ncbi:MAG: hypothetical protein HeimC2_00880 [Candidatus Heimdallarchaeota archaeon LC_2]|nr:MAG: hypothetical protein HeimC2_00880 [Candidatus Heimdallarchaeota archaeon LC_2]